MSLSSMPRCCFTCKIVCQEHTGASWADTLWATCLHYAGCRVPCCDAIGPSSYHPALPFLLCGQGEGSACPPFEDCFEPMDDE